MKNKLYSNKRKDSVRFDHQSYFYHKKQEEKQEKLINDWLKQKINRKQT